MSVSSRCLLTLSRNQSFRSLKNFHFQKNRKNISLEIPLYGSNLACHTCLSSSNVFDESKLLQQKEYFKLNHTIHNYCTKEFDHKNDPETKSILNEILSDFEKERQSHDISKENQTFPLGNETDNSSKKNDKGDDNKDDTVQASSPQLEYFIEEEDTTPSWTPPISLQRGTKGVFEVDEIVTLLEKENGRDIIVIDIPEEARFAEHMIIVSAVSVRHLRSMSSHIKYIHKRRKGHGDVTLKVEGFETDPDWHAMDLGNIILHLFMPETREKYDLETLWTTWGQTDHVDVTCDPYEITPEDDFWKSLEDQAIEKK